MDTKYTVSVEDNEGHAVAVTVVDPYTHDVVAAAYAAIVAYGHAPSRVADAMRDVADERAPLDDPTAEEPAD